MLQLLTLLHESIQALGAIILLPTFVCWISWPWLLITNEFITQDVYYYYLLPSLCITWALVGDKLVHENESRKPEVPKLVVLRITPSLKSEVPEHGMSITIEATKPEGFTFEAVQLTIGGTKLWEAIELVVNAALLRLAKFSFHPLNLCPTYLDPSTVRAGTTEACFVIHFGDAPNARISHSRITTTLQKLVEGNDPKLKMTFDYGVKDWGFKKQGLLLSFELPVSVFLENLVQGKSFLLPEKEEREIPVVQEKTSGSNARKKKQ